MTKAGRTTPDDLVLEWLSGDEWQEILAIKLPKKGRRLLENLRKNGNQPIKVTHDGYAERYSAICGLNQKLRLCGKTGYYLQHTDNKCWPDTSLRLYVRKTQ